MKTNINILRREEQIKNLIAQIITYEVTNSDVIEPTVVDCKLSSDLSHVKVFVTFGARANKGLEALEHAKGFVKKQVAQTLDWRKIPDIHFVLDELTDSAQKIDALLDEIKKEFVEEPKKEETKE
ncbi:30S ribosome-binding factor RbfA [Mycoplasmopsis iners]|uniref:30S ribosome-binding factor RbfA n=1 Tax=Mycoplasmopsis iners TaxID=76630 RepID=UPI00068BF9A6|nr:30S ribosome-binding factor RbfA [Mycoplasmopsis iners]